MTLKLEETASPALQQNEEAAAYFCSLLFDTKPQSTLPDFLGGVDKAVLLQETIMEIREVLRMARYGEYDYKVNFKGFIGGMLKAIQSNLRHAAYMALCVAKGDFEQRLDFLGEFSDAFNIMTQQLKDASLRLQEAEERWRLALETSRDGVWDIDLDSPKNSFFSRNFYDMNRYSSADAFSIQQWLDNIHPDDSDASEVLSSCISREYSGNTFSISFRLMCGDGAYRWRAAKGQIFRSKQGEISRIIGILEDIHEQKEREDSFAHKAMHDSLTGLPNRESFNKQMKQMTIYAHRTGTFVIVAMLDLDKFKLVNDTLGHHAGDILLITIAKRLQKALRNSDLVARLGGDEFAMLLPCESRKHEDTVRLIERIQTLLNEPVMLETTLYSITASIGLSVYPADGESTSVLLKRADKAMYKAKMSGRNSFCFWDASMAEEEEQEGQEETEDNLPNSTSTGTGND